MKITFLKTWLIFTATIGYFLCTGSEYPALKRDVTYFSETMVTICKTTRCYVREDSNTLSSRYYSLARYCGGGGNEFLALIIQGSLSETTFHGRSFTMTLVQV
jgi:hypothetical protein